MVTPCFNAARFIRETLGSVLHQEFDHIEYVVVDGGSTDGTAEIIQSQSDSLAWWVSEPDEGQASALNKGFARSTGDVLGFINGDDVLMPGAIRAVAQAFAAHPEVEIIYGGVEWIDASGASLGRHTGEISSLTDILDIYRVWWGRRQWVQPEVFFRRQLWERIGVFDTQYHLAFDFDYWVRCFVAGACALQIPQCLVRFRLHKNQKSTASRQAAAEIRQIVKRALDAEMVIPRAFRRRLGAQLSYDLYQSNDAGAAQRQKSFGRALLQHPEWLLYAPEARERLRAACVGRWLSASKGTTRDP